VKWYGKYGRKASRIVIRYGQYGRKASWIVKRYGKYGRKASWNVKWYGKYRRKISWIVNWFGKYGRKASRKVIRSQIATLRWADVGLRAFGSLAQRRNPTLVHRNVAHWRHVGPTVSLQPYANSIPPLSNVDPTSVKTIYNHVPT
jgi:hypothetical protein